MIELRKNEPLRVSQRRQSVCGMAFVDYSCADSVVMCYASPIDMSIYFCHIAYLPSSGKMV